MSEDDKQQTLKDAEKELSNLAGVDLAGQLVPARNGSGIDVDGMGSLVALQPGGDDQTAARDNTLTGDQMSMTVGESWQHATSFWTRYVLSLAFWISTSAERVPGEHTSRAVRRSLDRAGLPFGDVSTIRLRHLEQVDDDAETDSGSAKVEYSHRWVVSPHNRALTKGRSVETSRWWLCALSVRGLRRCRASRRCTGLYSVIGLFVSSNEFSERLEVPGGPFVEETFDRPGEQS